MLSVRGLRKTFGAPPGGAKVIDGVDFEIARAHCYALLGPSGCGKTTTLRCIAGLEYADEGVIAIGGRIVCDPQRGVFVPVHERPIGMVFQSYAIWPHLDVFENVAYPLRVARPRIARAEIEQRVMEVLALVGMQERLRQSATLLSGGQQQRVALARAVVRRPELLLLDEPLSNLYARLRSSFIASFIGAANVLAGAIEDCRDGVACVLLRIGDGGQRLRLAATHTAGCAVEVVIRPEDMRVSTTPHAAGPNVLAGTVRDLRFQGSLVECEVEIGDARIRAIAHPSTEVAQGAPVWLHVDPDRCTMLAVEAGSI